MERITIKDLTKKLNDLVEPVSDGIETSEVMVLEDTIWGLENGVYRPLGELQLPIQYANGRFYDNEVPYISYDLFTLFTHDFFEGIIAKSEGRNLYSKVVIDGIKRSSEEERPLYINNEGFSDRTSSRKVVQGFLEEFFQKYQDLPNLTDEEVRECLQRSFIVYR